MKDNKRSIKLIMLILAIILIVIELVVNYHRTGEIDENKLGQALNIVTDEINQINQSSTEIPNLTETDEQTLEVQETEDESFELQGEIAYEGDAKHWNLSTDDNPQLTYISQIDSRWKNYPYTSINNSTQTIGSSGCGVACRSHDNR